jgi:hypothetical protein
MNSSEVAGWVDRYVEAWNSNDPGDIRSLFTTDASYYTSPFRVPWRGQDTIVREWLGRKDEPGNATFRYEVLATGDGLGMVRGWTQYRGPAREYSNIWLVRLDSQGRCSEFIEWWMAQPEE